MYNRILAPLDGSRLSAAVLPYVRWLATALKLPVVLLHVNDPARLAPYSPPMQGGDYLEKIAASFSGFTNVKCAIELGNPAEVIINTASAEPGTLVAMATHGYSGAMRWLLGSVAEKALHALDSDLLLVRPEGANGSGQLKGCCRLCRNWPSFWISKCCWCMSQNMSMPDHRTPFCRCLARFRI